MGTPQSSAIPATCPRCRRAWPSSLSTCPDDGAYLHVQLTEPFSESVVTETRTPAPFDEHDTATDLNGRRDPADATAISPPFAGPPTSLVAVGAVSSGEITAQTARAAESETPPTAQPASDPTTETRPAPGFVHLVPGTLVGEYVIERLLGSGGMGAVYGGRHERLGKRVAVKVIAPALSVDIGAVERFDQESLALASLAHPNIVNVLSVGTLPIDRRSYYIMEWLEGSSLQTRLDRGRVPLDEALDIVDQVARGLDAAHAAGIVHRDLKPDNVWLQQFEVGARPIVKLLDFGLAKLREHRRTENTATNVMFGTPQFMSPEQCRSARDVGPATDVYALACVMFELLTGRLPFIHDNMPELIVAHQTEEPPHLQALDPTICLPLDELTFAMLAKDSARRPTLAAVRSTIASVRRLDFKEQVQDVRVSTSTRTSPRIDINTSGSKQRSRRGIMATTAAALVLLSFLLANSVMRSHDGDIVVPTIDAPESTDNQPKPVDQAVEVVQQSGDQHAARSEDTNSATRTPTRRTESPRPPAVPEIAQEQVDAGVSIVVDAAVSFTPDIDAGPGVDDPQASPRGAVVEQRPTADQNPKPPIDRKPQRAPDPRTEPPRGRDPARDRTWNPFKKVPR